MAYCVAKLERGFVGGRGMKNLTELPKSKGSVIKKLREERRGEKK